MINHPLGLGDKLKKQDFFEDPTFRCKFISATRSPNFPIDHLMHVRDITKRLATKGTTRTITDGAFDCGFSDSNYFSRCFHKMMDQTPKQQRLA